MYANRFFGRIFKALKMVLSRLAYQNAAPTRKPPDEPSEPPHKQISATYQRLLGREPDEHEQLHWSLCLAGGIKPEDIANSLTEQFDFEEKRLSAQRVLTQLPEFKMFVSPRDLDVGRTIFSTGSHEPHIGEMLRVKLKPGSVLLDLGANIGYFSLLGATLVRENGKVISFEPNVQNLRLFHASIAENQFKNIVVYPLAVSDSVQIHQLRAFGSNGYLQDLNHSEASAQFVQSVLIDQVLQAEKRIDLVKMDIEGYEILALRGMRQTIERFRPILIAEFNPWHIQHRSKIAPENLLREIEQMGYRLSIIERDGPIRLTTTESLMSHWRSTNNDKMIVDLLAEPR